MSDETKGGIDRLCEGCRLENAVVVVAGDAQEYLAVCAACFNEFREKGEHLRPRYLLKTYPDGTEKLSVIGMHPETSEQMKARRRCPLVKPSRRRAPF